MRLSALFLFLIFSSLLLAAEVPSLKPGLNDFAGVVAPADAARINELSARMRGNATAEIAVLVINSTEGADLAQYSVEVAQKNGIGKKGMDNGILMVIAVQDRAWRIDVGYGLEGALPDGKIGRIGREYLVPYLRNGRWGEGIYSALSAIGAELGAEGVAAPERMAAQDDDAGTVLVLMSVFGLMVLFMIVASMRMGSWRHPKGGMGGFGGMGGGFGGGGFGSGAGGFGGGSFGGGGAGGKF